MSNEKIFTVKEINNYIKYLIQNKEKRLKWMEKFIIYQD